MRALTLCLLVVAAGCEPAAPPVTYEVEPEPAVEGFHKVEGEVTNETGNVRDIRVEVGCDGRRHEVLTLHSVAPGATAWFTTHAPCGDGDPSVLSASYGRPRP